MMRLADFNLPNGNQVGARAEGWPISGPITQIYGQQSVTGSKHGGMDIAAPRGTPVYAPWPGVCGVFTKEQGWGFGNWVRVTNDEGEHAAMAHLLGFTVSPGQRVNEGDLVGFCDSTGVSTGDHVHFALAAPDNPYFALNFSQLIDPATRTTEVNDMALAQDLADVTFLLSIAGGAYQRMKNSYYGLVNAEIINEVDGAIPVTDDSLNGAMVRRLRIIELTDSPRRHEAAEAIR